MYSSAYREFRLADIHIFFWGGAMKSNRRSTMKRLMMAGLLVSGLLFWQAAHATTDMTCSNLDNLIRGRFNCCASTTSSGVCDGLFKAAEEANCGDVCNPCFEFGYAPAPAGCGCTINPDDPDL